MGMSSADFQNEATRLALKYYYPGMMTAAQINAVFTGLGSAVTGDNANLADVTLKTPAGTLSPSSWPDSLTRELELLINKGRNSLGPTAMGSILTTLASGGELPPINTAAPVVSAPGLSVAGPNTATTTNGTWSNSPTSYTYQWLRAGAPMFPSTGNTHTLVSADIGFLISCMVTARNAAGSATATSNSIGPVTA
jgi:hypothetical protein